MIARTASAAALAAGLLAACDAGEPVELISYDPDPYPSTYEPLPSETTAIVNAHILDGVGGEIDNGVLVIENGRIAALGDGAAAPEGAVIVDAEGRWVTPGIIDIHSHLGVYPVPSVSAHQDGNEISAPVTAEVWAEHGVWPQDPG
ncbi:MAG: amidohydrolase, partial [Maricaulaceae bacterium]